MLASGGPMLEAGGLLPHHYQMAASFRDFLRPQPKPPIPHQPPVNLTHKEEPPEEYASYPPPPPHRMFPPPGAAAFSQLGYGPYGTLYPAPYTPVMRHNHPLEVYPRYAASPPHSPLVKTKHHLQPPPHQQQHRLKQAPPPGRSDLFKAPPGKEGSLKHRILRKKATPSTAPAAPSFSKGSLIQLATGELKRVEDMRTEDFINSAQQSTAHRLDPSTLVRIDNPNETTTLLTLSYGQTRSQVEIESPVEHPYFVYGKGWASCSPARSFQLYGLKCHRLQVGDVCISLSPRSTPNTQQQQQQQKQQQQQQQQQQLPEGRKRRWSAPDQLPDHPPHQRPKES